MWGGVDQGCSIWGGWHLTLSSRIVVALKIIPMKLIPKTREASFGPESLSQII